MIGPTLNRRRLAALIAATGGATLGACAQIADDDKVARGVGVAEVLTRTVQRLILSPGQLAPEYRESEISKFFKPNGSTDPESDAYVALRDAGFKDWKLEVIGLVEHPLSLSLDQLRAQPSRTQITRHDCVEGWSAIGGWTGVPLRAFLERVGADLRAKYVAFKTADDYPSSIDMATALHPQTLLATQYAGETLADPFGYPLRLRMSTKLGYKNPKWITAMEVTNIYPGGFWEEKGFPWFAGI